MADTKKPKHSEQPIPSLTDERYERTDARLSAVIITSLLLVAAAVMSAVAVWYYYGFALDKLKTKRAQTAHFPGRPAEIPANAPKLQLTSNVDLRLFNEEQRVELESYGWVSKEAQVVHIPIDRAIELTAERKLPSDVAKETTGTAPDNGADLPQDSSSGRTYWNLQR